MPSKRVPPKRWVNPQTGELTIEALAYLDDLENGSGVDAPSLGTLLSGLNTTSNKTNGIIAGTQTLVDVNISGRGSVTGELDAVTANTASAATSASAGALSASISAAYAFASGVGGGPFTTTTPTVTAAGGTAPYTYAWAKVSGDTLTVNSPTAASTNFTGSPGIGNILQAVYRCTVTDSAGSPATATVDVAVSITDLTPGI